MIMLRYGPENSMEDFPEEKEYDPLFYKVLPDVAPQVLLDPRTFDLCPEHFYDIHFSGNNIIDFANMSGLETIYFDHDKKELAAAQINVTRGTAFGSYMGQVFSESRIVDFGVWRDIPRTIISAVRCEEEDCKGWEYPNWHQLEIVHPHPEESTDADPPKTIYRLPGTTLVSIIDQNHYTQLHITFCRINHEVNHGADLRDHSGPNIFDRITIGV